MNGAFLVLTVGAVGVLHTLVPDHWAPIVAIARQRRWSALRSAQAGAVAGVGHVVSTLALGAVLYVVGASAAARYGHTVSVVAALALIAFGAWIAYGGWQELRAGGHAHDHDHGEPDGALRGRTAFLLIVGSSPMIEGLPAFLAASTHGIGLLALMAAVFAATTIVTYAATCGAGVAGLRRVSLGPLERYGEVLSGAVVVLAGIYAFVTA